MGRSYTAGEPRKSYKYSTTIWRLDRSIGSRHMSGKKHNVFRTTGCWPALLPNLRLQLTSPLPEYSLHHILSNSLPSSPISNRRIYFVIDDRLAKCSLINSGEIKGWVDEGDRDGDKTKTLELDIIPTR